jgi:amino acid adenylation domain-containing protein
MEMAARNVVRTLDKESERSRELRTPMPWRTEYPRDATVHGLFLETALTNPYAVAIESEEGTLTYAALLARAQGIAAALRRRGAGSGTLVGLAVERSPAAIAVMLGILMVGGVYVPLELNGTPASLLQQQVRSSGLSLLLCDQPLLAKDWEQPWWRGCELLSIAHLENELLPAGSDFAPAKGLATDPAYIMFTSGSTGQPKGVMVAHRGIVRLMSGQEYLDFGPEKTFLLHSPLGFDASTLEIWGSLLHGGRLVIAPARPLAVNDFEHLAVRYGVTTLWLSASVFHMVADHVPTAFATLKELIVGGDVVSPSRVEKTLRTNPHLQIVNGYGPTENTTFTACYRVPHDFTGPGSLPIGKPIHGTWIRVLGSDRYPVPDGEVGELAAGGDGVALGYVDAPEMTAARFLPDPLSDDPAARMYLTGDLVRMKVDGNLEFVGRVDQEVKVAGHRVDLKELEELLGAHPAVQQAVASIVSDELQEKRLYAFVRLHPGSSGAATMLREYLSSHVHASAIPSQIVEVEEISLNANGKVDRERLLRLIHRPVPLKPNPGRLKESPVTARDEVPGLDSVWSAWRGVLHREDVGLDENFFDAGGTSLLLMELHLELNRCFPGRLTLVDLFSATTVRKMSEHLAAVRNGYQNATMLKHRKAHSD